MVFTAPRVLIKASGNDTLGQLAVLESVYPPGLSRPCPRPMTARTRLFYVIVGGLAWHVRRGNLDRAARKLRVRTSRHAAQPQGHEREPAIVLVIIRNHRLVWTSRSSARAEPVPDSP